MFKRPKKDGLIVHVIAYEAEEGGWWAEVPSIPGCATQGETTEELRRNLSEAIRGCLSVEVELPPNKGATGNAQVLAVAV